RETLRFLEVNEAVVEQYGFTRRELLAMTTTDIRPAEEVDRYKASMRNLGNGLEWKGHWWHRRKDGSVFEVEATCEAITFSGRDAILVVAQDMTARRKAENAAAEKNTYLQAFVENLPLAVMVLDSDRRIEMCNPAFEELFGYSLKEIRGLRPESFLEPP